MTRRDQLLSQINELKELKSKTNGKLAQYQVYTNKGLSALLTYLHESTCKKLDALYAEYWPLEKMRLEQYKNSTTHKSLMATAGMSGFQILTSLQ